MPWSEALWKRSRLAAGGTLLAARLALEEGIAGNLAGGTHHAFADHAEGFCVLNDVAIAIAKLRAERRVQRAVIIDLDVHQGNGTAAIFEGSDEVVTFSMHGERNYPLAKMRSTVDVALADGTETRRISTRSTGICRRCLKGRDRSGRRRMRTSRSTWRALISRLATATESSR